MANMLYNGVEMPDIMAYLSSYPEVPYHYIYKTEVNYVCVSSSVPLIVLSGGDIASTQRYITGTALWYFGESDKWSGGTSYQERPATYSYYNLSTDTLVWSSYDIINSADGSVYFAGSEPVDPNAPTEPTYDRTAFLSGLAMGLCGKGDPTSDMAVSGSGGGASGNMLYNGVELPNLDSLDVALGDYPARIIQPYESSYRLFLSSRSFDVSSAKPFVRSSGSYFFANGPANLRQYSYNEASSSWEFVWSFSLADMRSQSIGLTSPIWCNGDLIEDFSGSIIVAASDPVPVGGTTSDTFTKGYLAGAELRRKRVIVERKPVEYLTFVSAEPFTLSVNNATKNWDGTLHYSTDAETWNEWGGASTIASAEQDGEQKIYMRGVGNSVITGNSADYHWVLKGNNIQCTGNIETLLDWETVESGGCPEMADYCYHAMFYGCTSLATAPALPATTLSNYCYYCMFYGCTSLATAPTLPATTLADYCYYAMFYGCTSLATAPALPAATLSVYCYTHMFRGCTSLATAPTLPVTTLADHCYHSMFQDCTSLATAPALPAATLSAYCYAYMFYGCTSLATAPTLPATTLADYCYYSMFYGCTSLATAPALPAATLSAYCYAFMFQSCTRLVTAPALPATTLADHCYYCTFQYCTDLATAPTLPATTLAAYCYVYMFRGCTGLVSTPALPATTLAESCCYGMFYDCTSLATLPKLLATELPSACYAYMFYRCVNIKLSETQTDVYRNVYTIIPDTGALSFFMNSVSYMFSGTGGTTQDAVLSTDRENMIMYTSNTIV